MVHITTQIPKPSQSGAFMSSPLAGRPNFSNDATVKGCVALVVYIHVCLCVCLCVGVNRKEIAKLNDVNVRRDATV